MAGEGLRPRHPPRVAHLLTQGRGECPCSANDKAVAALIPPLASVTRAVVPVDEVLMMFLQRSFRAQRSVLDGTESLIAQQWLETPLAQQHPGLARRAPGRYLSGDGRTSPWNRVERL